MKKLNSLWLAFGLLFQVAPGSAQAPFPPSVLSSALSPEAAAQALGAPKPEFSTHVLLATPEISLPGEVAMSVNSEIPGTSRIFLFRQFPRVSSTTSQRPSSSSPGPGAPAARSRPGTVAPSTLPAPTPTVFIAAIQLEPGEPPKLNARVTVDRNERFTTLVYAQGRWFFTARELKLARPLHAATP